MAVVSDADVDQTVEANILYDLTVQAEWRLDPEPTSRYARDKTLVHGRGTIEQSSAWSFLFSSVSPSGVSDLPSGLVKLVNSQINWKFALTQTGDVLAILQDSHVEIRTSENEFTTLRSKWNLSSQRDSFPQWRCLSWSGDGSMLAISDSSGQIDIFDPVGGLLCHIPSRLPASHSFGQSLCALVFKELRAVNVSEDQHWFTELLAVDFQGYLTAYLISQEGDYRPSHSFDFTNFYPDGISSVIYHRQHSLLVVGGSGASAGSDDTSSAAFGQGISAWRILSGLPYYKHITDYGTDRAEGLMRRPLVKRFRSRFLSWSRDVPPDGIFKLSLSPNGCLLACVHYSGTLTLWDVPSFRLRLTWPLESQPDFDQVNEEVAGNPKLRKQMKEYLNSFFLIDVGWWSDKALILARGNGAVVVSSVESLKNLLGSSPEWFEPAPVVAVCSEGSFLGLECESNFRFPKRHLDSESERNASQEEEQEEDTDDENSATVGTRVSHYIRQGLYYVTDSERFQPPRKKPKLIERVYRLICLKSTTPEELYARKINNEEYGEALSLAQSYQLDSDLVYQRQWRNSPVSVTAIQDYLTKIGKRSWVLHECLERVPEDFDAMNELLKYGLQGTDLEALVTIGRKEDKGKFILCQPDYDVYHTLDAPDDDSAAEAHEKESRRKREWLKEIDFNNLSLEQQELCRIRLKLLQYTDRLMTYQAILGGIHVSVERYDYRFFEKFRSQNIIEMAVEYARVGDALALDYLFTYHGKETLPHRLIILGNFPETYSPKKYSNLLPEVSCSGDPDVVPWLQESWRESDWCEENYSAGSSVNEDYLQKLYEEQPEYSQFRKEITHGDLIAWYKLRAFEIEALSGQVDNSLELLNLALEKNLQGLNELLDDLLAMETLVYECRADESLTLSRLRKMSDIEKLRLMMSRSSEEMYLKNLRKWVVPFLHKCDDRSPGAFQTLLREYLVGLAADDLTLCALVFKSSNANKPIDPVITDQSHLMSMALDCIYACEKNDQLEKSFEILHCLPQQNNRYHQSEGKIKLFDAVDELKRHLEAASILEKNGIPQQIKFIRDTQKSKEEAMKILTRIMRTAARQQPSIGERKLKVLLDELLLLTEKVYRCIDRTTCYEVFVESLLCSGCHENIELAGRMIERTAQHHASHPHRDETRSDIFQHRVSYAESVRLVLEAAREYFDSSATLNDSDMQLARTCLGLIDQNAEVEEERDLIEAVSMLEGFRVSILPVQVRICKNRLQLIEKAISARPSAYRNSQRLVRLGRLLRIGGDSADENRGQILRIVADRALQNNDFKTCYEACVQLMDIGYADAWRECRSLAEMEEYSDIQAKLELLSFSVVHCSPDMIESILRAKMLLQTQLLCEKIHAHVGDRDSVSPSSPPLSHRGILSQTKDVLGQTKDVLRSTNKATQSILLHISSSKWWKKTISGLHPAKRDQNVDDYDDLNNGFRQQSCHPFFESVFEKCYSNRSEADYVGICHPKTDISGGLTVSEGLLRMAKLEETVSEGQNINLASQVLLRLAEDVIVQDSTLGLAYLLALPDPTEADVCFGKIPGTKISLQLASYYYALQIASHLTPQTEPKLSDVYQFPPNRLSEKVIEYVKGISEQKKASDWPPPIRKMAQRLIDCNELLLDYVQAQTLEELDKGVDVSRFVQEDSYKKETILGMVLCLDDDAFKIASSLAARHRIPIGDVCMAHLEYLFEEPSLTTEQIESRIQSLGILAELTHCSGTYVRRMETNVYPLIEGTNLDRLLLFYSLLSGFSADENPSVLSASAHVKLLQRIKNDAPDLNYKRLTDRSCDPLEVLSPVLSKDNVNAIAKLASNITSMDGRPLTGSNVYRLWSVKLFWEGFHGRKTSANQSEWIPLFDNFWDSVKKLDPGDFIIFIQNIAFSREAVSQLSIDCRRQVLRRTLKHAKQQSHQEGGTKGKAAPGEKLSWDEVVSRIQRFLEHIDRLSIPFVLEAKNSTDPAMNKYAEMFDLTCSRPEQVKDLLVTMILDGQPLDVVQKMCDAVSKIGDFKPKLVAQKALNLITAAIKIPRESHSAVAGRDLIQALKHVVSCVADHQASGGNLVTAEDLVSVVHPFCSDPNVDVEVRLNILEILSKSLKLGPVDQSLILLNQTRAKVSVIGVNIEVTDAVKTDEGRQLLFDQLLSVCDRTFQLKIVKELLDIWPELHSTKQNADNPAMNGWCRLVDRFLRTSETQNEPIDEFLPIISSLCSRESLSAECVSFVSDLLLNSEPLQLVTAAKCLLISPHMSLYAKAIDLLKQLTEDFKDEDLFDLVLRRHLVTKVISTPFYASLVEHLLCNQCTDSSQTPDYIRVDLIARQMQDAGYQAEAGTLVMQFRSMHRSLRTFDAAFSIITNLFRR